MAEMVNFLIDLHNLAFETRRVFLTLAPAASIPWSATHKYQSTDAFLLFLSLYWPADIRPSRTEAIFQRLSIILWII